MKGGFTAQENAVVDFLGVEKKAEPMANGLSRHRAGAVHIAVDIAMTAGKIAGREQMEKNIPFAGRKIQGTYCSHETIRCGMIRPGCGAPEDFPASSCSGDY